jgi:uncharacterized membrane protein
MEINEMADPKEKLTAILYSAIVGVLTAFGGSVMIKGTTMSKVITFSAGVAFSIATALILTEFDMAEKWKELICGGVAAFVSTWLPAAHTRVKTFVETFDLPFLKTKKPEDKDGKL